MKRPLLVAAGLAAAAAATALPAQAQSEIGRCRNPAVVMLSASWCGYCRKARHFFEDNRIDFEEIDAERSPSESIRLTARRHGVPYIIVGGEAVRGFNERRLRELLCIGM